MRIVLTGGSGFLGGAIAASLRHDGHEVLLPLRSPGAIAGAVAIRPLEAMTPADWPPLLASADAVVHAAAIAHVGLDIPESRYIAVNSDASARLAEAAARAGVRRFVFLSSIRAQVGPHSDQVQSEGTPPLPTEPYGRSKLEAERLISAVFPEATHLRPALVVGPGAKGNLAAMVRAARSPLPLPFGAFRAPQAVIGCGNLIEAVALALRSDRMPGETFVVADDPHPSLADMLRWLREGMGRPARLVSVPAGLMRWPLALAGKGQAFDRLTSGLVVDSSKLRSFGWPASRPIADAFREIGRVPLSPKPP